MSGNIPYTNSMCGRFTLHTTPEHLVEEFALPEMPLLEPRYNIAPSQPVAALRLESGQRRLAMLRWGLVPFWAKDDKIAHQHINARSETAAEKPAFREAFAKRRCLILADGFYEWQKAGKVRQPFYIRRVDGRPFAFAALWEHWHSPSGEPLETCAILTTSANATLAPLHERMPVLLDRKAYAAWIDPNQKPERLVGLLKPLAGDLLQIFPVSDFVNSPRNEGPACLEPFSAQAATAEPVPTKGRRTKKSPVTSDWLFPPESP